MRREVGGDVGAVLGEVATQLASGPMRPAPGDRHLHVRSQVWPHRSPEKVQVKEVVASIALCG